MPVDVLNRQRKVPVDKSALERRAHAMMMALGEAESELCVTLVSDARIRVLNRQYRGKDSPTDVLSFGQSDVRFVEPVTGMPRLLGDVVISAETAERQAAERARELSEPAYGLMEELTFLVAHGLLHVLGFDHEEERDATIMEAKERELVAAFFAWPPRANHA